MKRGKRYVEAAKAIDRATLYDTADCTYPCIRKGTQG